MDNKFLIRLNDSFKTIKTRILLNEEVRKYLYYDNIDDNTTVPSINQVVDNVFIQPVIEVDASEPFNKKNYITITVPEGDKENNRMAYAIRIIVMCEKSCWNINGDVRPLLIAQELINTLDGFKTYLSNSLSFDSIVETVTSKDVYGYSLLFNVTDGISDINDKK